MLDFTASYYLLIINLILLTCVSIALVLSKKVLSSIVLLSVFSLLIGLSYLLMDAPDVAMTEVALGSSLSTCVLLNFCRIVNINDRNNFSGSRMFLPLFLCIIIFIILAFLLRDFPEYGNINEPLHSGIGKYYLENTYKDTGAISPVAVILGSYRGFDTLGETAVIFIAGLGVALIIGGSERSSISAQKSTLSDLLILRTFTLFILPFVFIYALYIQLNGESAPGGGFQAGVIFASMFIAFDLIYGKFPLLKQECMRSLIAIAALGVLIYGCTGLVSLFIGSNYLNYYVLVSNPAIAQQIGIEIVEIGVGLTVSAVMCLIYRIFSDV